MEDAGAWKSGVSDITGDNAIFQKEDPYAPEGNLPHNFPESRSDTVPPVKNVRNPLRLRSMGGKVSEE